MHPEKCTEINMSVEYNEKNVQKNDNKKERLNFWSCSLVLPSVEV